MGRSEYHKVLFQAAKDMPKFWLPRQHETSTNGLSLSYLCNREVTYKYVLLDSGILDSNVRAILYETTQDESAELCLISVKVLCTTGNYCKWAWYRGRDGTQLHLVLY